eukprot:6174912-Pleurochrysis_carterae.AAC.1
MQDRSGYNCVNFRSRDQVAMVELWLGLGSQALGSDQASDNAADGAYGDAGARGVLAWPFTGFSYL